jgi:hypothetical protein
MILFLNERNSTTHLNHLVTNTYVKNGYSFILAHAFINLSLPIFRNRIDTMFASRSLKWITFQKNPFYEFYVRNFAVLTSNTKHYFHQPPSAQQQNKTIWIYIFSFKLEARNLL